MSITVASITVLRSSSTLVPATLAALVCATLPPPIPMVILVRSTELRVSLNVRITCVPSVDVVGASAPVVTSVGRLPSTLWLASIATATV